MIVINGVKIADASADGFVLLRTDEMSDFRWIDPSIAHMIIGDEYFNNKKLRQVMTDDYERAMEQCTDL